MNQNTGRKKCIIVGVAVLIVYSIKVSSTADFEGG